MAEDSDLDRSEPASQRRLEQARAKGQVPRSPELSTFVVLLAAGAGLIVMGGNLIGHLRVMLQHALTVDRAAAFETPLMAARLYDAAIMAMGGLWPLLLLVLAAALAAPLLVSGWLFSFDAIQPDFGRLNPVRGLARMFSTHGLVELGKASLKTLIIGGVASWVIWSQLGGMLALLGQPLPIGLARIGHMLGTTLLAVVGAMGLIVALDVPFQIWDHGRQLRMTKEEVKQESRDNEGDPQIKGRIRQLQRERARKRMMQEVPKADVVVTNPTRFACALRYQQGERAPRLVAKGSLFLAERIVELARENNVPVLRAPPLARALFAHAEIGNDIPAPLYAAVAEVLAWVYQLRQPEGNPQLPAQLPVPPEMDPGAEELSEAETMMAEST
jgi:flagellar biosynthetic protein FlhB